MFDVVLTALPKSLKIIALLKKITAFKDSYFYRTVLVATSEKI